VLIHADPIARCDTTGEAKRQDWETCNFVAHAYDDLRRFSGPHGGLSHGDIHPTLESTNPKQIVAFNARQDPDHWHDRTGPLDTDGGTQAVAFAQNSRDEVREMPYVGALAAEPGMKQTSYIRSAMQVRRLTPRECERLQGFPDDYTRIPWKLGYWPADKHSADVRGAIAEQCPDGPRYKALGNSWAVPVVRWIGERIQRAVDPT
jgi:site-specific DNA-cytosine methylase